MKVKITVPATSANVGPGFDALGLALTLYNSAEIEEWDSADIISEDSADVPRGEDNLIYRAAAEVYKMCGRKLLGLRIRQRSAIPMTRGLGSSSACLICGILGANALLKNPLTRHEAANLAARLEGHPDNVAPAIFGGFITAVFDGERVEYIKAKIPPDWKFLTLIPPFELKTDYARSILPETVSRGDAVYNLSRAAMTAAAFMTADMEKLASASGDRLHQPYRLPLIPGAAELTDFARSAGAGAAFISGAGPTVIVITSRDDAETDVAGYVRERLPDWAILSLRGDNAGAAECIERI